MEETECEQAQCEAGAPAWVMTFADLMSLLMVFFVLLLSFSEMDVQKYKQVAGSMKMAFGVQREVQVMDMPTGTSIISQEFSPAQPEPTLVNEVRQETVDAMKDFLEIEERGVETPAEQEAREKAKQLEEALAEEIAAGLLGVSAVGDQVVIRIREKGSFASASAAITDDFRKVVVKISDAIAQVDGNILIGGHTDDIPIRTREFPSNWVLSAARAAAVAHTMIDDGGILAERVEIRAYAENRPLESNDTPVGRATNRRVEIIVLSSDPDATAPDPMNGEQAEPDDRAADDIR